MSPRSGTAPTSSSLTEDILLVTLGDPNGIGPEVAAKSAGQIAARGAVALIGPGKALAPWTKYLGCRPQAASAAELAAMASRRKRFSGAFVVDPTGGVFDPMPGRMTAAAAWAAFRSLETAVGLLKKNPARFALVTAPMSKEACLRAGLRFSGHTGFLGRAFGARPVMLLTAGDLRVGLVTEHIPLAEVPERITRSNVLRTLKTFARGLSGLGFGRKPVIGVLGLNPHAGEGGRIGTEDGRIAAAVRAFNRLNFGRAVGPIPGDSAYAHPEKSGRGKNILAMYHDQGLIPVKMAGIDRAVNITLGLPARRTSPAHGTAFHLAGRGIADPRSMALAMEWALRMSPPAR